MRTGADHVAVGEKSSIGLRVDLPRVSDVQVAVFPQGAREILGEAMVLRARRAAEIIPGEAESLSDIPLDFMLFAAIELDGLAGFERGQLAGVPCSSVAQINSVSR